MLKLHQYIPIAALQLIATAFCLLQASKTASAKAALDALVLDTLPTLAYQCTLLLVPQAWFGDWCRRQRLSVNETVDEGVKRATPPAKNLSQRLAKDFRTGKLPPAPSFDLEFIARAATLTPLSIALVHFLIVMLGAPFFSHSAETALLSSLISILALLPIFVAIPQTEPFGYVRLVSSPANLDAVQTALVYPALGTIVGAYSGSFAIPLDWDRPWQKWPVTCVVGALAGHATGTLAGVARVGYLQLFEAQQQKQKKS